MATSKLQKRVSQLLSTHLGGFTIRENTHPEWLAFEGARLELDFLIEELDCAIEVNGMQHYEYTPFFHSSESQFQTRLRRDKFKVTACEDKGVALYVVCSEMDAIIAIKSIIEKVRPEKQDMQVVDPFTKPTPKWIKQARKYNKRIGNYLRCNRRDVALKWYKKLKVLLEQHNSVETLKPFPD